MNNLYKKILLVLLVFQIFISQSYAQLTDEGKIEEVYGVHFFDNKLDLKNFFLRLLQNRIQIVVMRQEPNEKYEHLNNVRLLDKFNPDMIRDITYDPATFNPLKYQMNFYAKSTMVYRIDSDYIIVITPQN